MSLRNIDSYPEDPLGVIGSEPGTEEYFINAAAREQAIPNEITDQIEAAASAVEFGTDDSPYEIIEKLADAGGVIDNRGAFIPMSGVISTIEAVLGGNHAAEEELTEGNGLRKSVLELLKSDDHHETLADMVELFRLCEHHQQSHDYVNLVQIARESSEIQSAPDTSQTEQPSNGQRLRRFTAAIGLGLHR